MDPPQPRRHNNQPQLQAGSVFSRNRRLLPPTPPRGTPLDDCGRRQKMDPPQPRRHNNQPQLQAGSVFSRNRRLRPPTPPRGTPLDDCVEWLGDSWMVLFLFETPTGFALFNYPGVKLFLPNAIELVILKDFQTFDGTSRAIDIHTGVCSKLADMIKNCLKPKQTLAVGNSDYKKVIEAKMRIYCLCNDAVMEVMWGLNNVLTTILPNEISSVTTGNYPKICQGMQMVLDCYGIHLEPELVNKRITEMVWSIHQFDSAVNKYHHILHLWGQTILEVSQIDTRQWDFLKLATTLMLLSYPKQVKNLSLGDSPEVYPFLLMLARYHNEPARVEPSRAELA